MTYDPRVLQERIDELAGVRRPGLSLSRSAVRIEDLGSLLQIPDALKSEKVSGTPDEGEHNALVDDVHMLHTRLLGIIAVLKARLGR